MQFGFTTAARDPATIPATARLAEETGWDLLGLADTPTRACDPWLALSVAAQHSTKLWLGPTVANALTRHPLILANLSEALHRLSAGRAFLGLGTGSDLLAALSGKPANLKTLADVVPMLRGLTSGEGVDEAGIRLKVWGGGTRIPIMIAGSGPRSLRLAGAVADWAFINIASDPAVVNDAIGWVREGAVAAGRAADAVQPWVFLPTSIAFDRAQAREEVKLGAVSVSAYSLRGDAIAKRIPPAVQAKIGEFVEHYDHGSSFTPGSSPNIRLADRLGLTEYLVDRCSISGTPEDCLGTIARLRAVGVERFCFSFTASPDLDRYVRLFGKHVLPELRRS